MPSRVLCDRATPATAQPSLASSSMTARPKLRAPNTTALRCLACVSLIESLLHRLVRREQTDLAVGHHRAELCAWIAEQYAGDQARRDDRLVQVAEVRGVLHERLGVPVPLEDDGLGLIVVEVDLVLQRAGVLRPHDLHASSGQA